MYEANIVATRIYLDRGRYRGHILQGSEIQMHLDRLSANPEVPDTGMIEICAPYLGNTRYAGCTKAGGKVDISRVQEILDEEVDVLNGRPQSRRFESERPSHQQLPRRAPRQYGGRT